jgi:hypothetical protein
MPGTRTTRQRHAVGAENFPGKFQRVKTAAAFARGIFRGNGWFGFHDFQTAKYAKKNFAFPVCVFRVVRG